MDIWYHPRYRSMHPLQKLIKKTLKAEGRGSSGSIGEATFALHAKSCLRFQPVTQFRFHHTRRWEFDFAWPLLKIALEVEGGIWRGRGRGSKTSDNTGGAHSHPTSILRDMEKYNAAAALGWRIFRFSTDQVKKGEAVAFMEKILK